MPNLMDNAMLTDSGTGQRPVPNNNTKAAGTVAAGAVGGGTVTTQPVTSPASVPATPQATAAQPQAAASPSGNSTFDQQYFTPEELRSADTVREAARNGAITWQEAHDYVENIRKGYGYSGGTDGSGFVALGGGTNAPAAYEAAQLPSYRAQEDAVNRLYEARQQAQLQNLKSAYDANLMTLEGTRGDIAPLFEEQRNAAAAESERQKLAFNEYAAANGLNSGAGGQAELARGNALAGNLTALNKEQAKQEAELDRQVALLKVQYQNDIAAAIADNDYQRLSELLNEYRTQEQSLVSTAQAQADENYRAWGAGYDAWRDSVSDQQYAEQFNYQKRRDELEDAYQRERDAVSDDQWERQFALAKASAARSYSSGGGNGDNTYKPTLTAAQAKAAYDEGNRSEQVVRDYLYYYGEEPTKDDGGYKSIYQEMYDLGITSSAEAMPYLYQQGFKGDELSSMLEYFDNTFVPGKQQTQTAAGQSGNDAWEGQIYNAVRVNNGRKVIDLPGYGDVTLSQLLTLVESGQVQEKVVNGKRRYTYVGR